MARSFIADRVAYAMTSKALRAELFEQPRQVVQPAAAGARREPISQGGLTKPESPGFRAPAALDVVKGILCVAGYPHAAAGSWREGSIPQRCPDEIGLFQHAARVPWPAAYPRIRYPGLR